MATDDKTDTNTALTDNMVLNEGDHSEITAGDDSKITAGYDSEITVRGKTCTATAGDNSLLTLRYDGKPEIFKINNEKIKIQDGKLISRTRPI